MRFSVHVVDGTSEFHTVIEAPSAEAAIRQLDRARGDSPVRFVFRRPRVADVGRDPDVPAPRSGGDRARAITGSASAPDHRVTAPG